MIDGHYSYKDVLEAETPDELTEASLSRVWQHLESGDSWGIISAWRGAYESLDPAKLQRRRAENNRRSDQLESDLQSMGYGYIPLKGRFKEEVDADELDPSDPIDPEDVEGGGVWVEERSFFVPQIERGDLVELGAKYDQDAVLFGEPGPDGEVVMIDSDSGETLFSLGPNEGSNLRPRKIGDAYSRVKGHAFAFGEPPGGARRDPALDESIEQIGEPLEGFHFYLGATCMAEAMMRSSPDVDVDDGDVKRRVERFVDGR